MLPFHVWHMAMPGASPRGVVVFSGAAPQHKAELPPLKYALLLAPHDNRTYRERWSMDQEAKVRTG